MKMNYNRLEALKAQYAQNAKMIARLAAHNSPIVDSLIPAQNQLAEIIAAAEDYAAEEVEELELNFDELIEFFENL